MDISITNCSIFQDLKKFHYFYWFAFPAPSQPTVHLREKSVSISSHFNNKQLEDITHGFKKLDDKQKCFFIVTKTSVDSVITAPLSSILKSNEAVQTNLEVDVENTYFTFLDPSNGTNPGWSLRLFLAALFEHCPELATKDIKLLGLRYNFNDGVSTSHVFTLKGSKVCIILLTAIFSLKLQPV